MTFTVNFNTIYFILAILGCIAILFLIVLLRNLIVMIKSIQNLINDNSESVSVTIKKMPLIANNVDEITDNVKNVSEVATEMTADIITVKDEIKENLETVTNFTKLMKNMFK